MKGLNTLKLAGCSITGVSRGYYLIDTLDLKECSGLKGLPESLRLSRLYLTGCSGLEALPESVGG